MNENLIQAINKYTKPLQDITDLDSFIGDGGNAKFVLLGESSHGTSKYYKIRAELSKRLILEKGFCKCGELLQKDDGNYVPSVMSERYDAFIFINESNELTPLKVEQVYL